jgi:ATP-dependent helicase/DNAse subunit B
LETFAACPLRYFYKYVLGLTLHPDPEKVLRLQPSDRGNLMHDILEKTLAEGVRSGWVRERALIQGNKTLAAEAEKAFRQFEKEGVPGAPGLWVWEMEQIRLDLRRVLKGVLADPDWVPLAFEIGFGDSKGSGAEVVFTAAGSARFRLQGRMDRVDLSSDGRQLRVVDYKSGSSAGAAKNAVKGGKKLQLPFYLWALKNLYPDKEATQALFDFVTRKGGYKKIGYKAGEAAPLEELLVQVLSTVSKGVENGLFPAAGKDCEPCDYKKLCGTGMKTRGERKKEDEKTRDYYALENLE